MTFKTITSLTTLLKYLIELNFTLYLKIKKYKKHQLRKDMKKWYEEKI